MKKLLTLSFALLCTAPFGIHCTIVQRLLSAVPYAACAGEMVMPVYTRVTGQSILDSRCNLISPASNLNVFNFLKQEVQHVTTKTIQFYEGDPVLFFVVPPAFSVAVNDNAIVIAPVIYSALDFILNKKDDRVVEEESFLSVVRFVIQRHAKAISNNHSLKLTLSTALCVVSKMALFSYAKDYFGDEWYKQLGLTFGLGAAGSVFMSLALKNYEHRADDGVVTLAALQGGVLLLEQQKELENSNGLYALSTLMTHPSVDSRLKHLHEKMSRLQTVVASQE